MGTQQKRPLARFPTLPILALVMVAALATLILRWQGTIEPGPWCRGILMTTKQVCSRTSRRGRVTYRDYAEVLAEERNALWAVRLGLVLILVLVVAVVVGLIFRWWRDQRALRDLPPTSELVSAGRLAGSWTVVGTLLAGLVLVFGMWYGFQLFAGGIGGHVGGSFILLLTAAATFGLVWGCWPRGGEFVEVLDDGLRLVRRGKVRTVPWNSVLVYRSAKGCRIGVVGELFKVRVPFALAVPIETATTAVWNSISQEQLQAGETVYFGPLNVSRTTVGIGTVSVPLDELSSITAAVGRPDELIFTLRDGRRLDPMPRREIAQQQVVDKLLRELVGLGIPGLPVTDG